MDHVMAESMVQMMSREVYIKNKEGLHMRLACMVAKEAQSFSCNIKLASDDRSADAKSILDILLLAAGSGTSLKLETKGKDAELALERIEYLFELH